MVGYESTSSLNLDTPLFCTKSTIPTNLALTGLNDPPVQDTWSPKSASKSQGKWKKKWQLGHGM